MTLSTGTRLSHYEITSQLGKGGMGEVYLAEDLSLSRKVALKFLPAEFTGDPERMARFEREAKVLASLNHANIASIYGLEQSEGKRFLVMELVEGENLAQRLGKGSLSVEEALEVCRQISDALEAAHEKGVIHRDLKPANVMITDGDKVKILDFGLAKAQSNETQSIDSSQSPTITEAMTRTGVILGTAAYMSPEQAKGKTVDKRADIWAFGCILYECLTGKRAFGGEAVSETLAAVLTKEPEWEKVPAKVNPLLHRCLERDPKKRLRDIGDAFPLIESTRESVPVKRSRLVWGFAAVCFLVSMLLGFLYFRKTSVEAPLMRLEISTPPTSDPISLAISPDGSRLVFVASAEGQKQLWLRPLDDVTAHKLDGTEGAKYPFWSPDSRSIGFFADGKLKRIDIAGGQPQVLASAYNGLGGTWNRDGVIIFVPSYMAALHRVSASGGEPVAIAPLNAPGQGHGFPQFLPDGRHLLFRRRSPDQGMMRLYFGSLDSVETRQLMVAESQTIYASPGYLLFMRQGTLYAQPFDATRGQLSGNPVFVADSVTFDSTSWVGGFSVSETGMLVYRTSNTNRHRLAWFDRSGNEVRALGVPDDNNLLDPELSSDGSRIVVERTVQGNRDVWLIDATRGVPVRFTSDAATDLYPKWSPDGSRIVFSSIRKSYYDLYQKVSSGAGNEELVLESSLNKFPNDWSPDGRFIIYEQQHDSTSGSDLWVLPLSGERKPFAFANTTFDEDLGQFSPDGRWVAYQCNESGRYEVYVQPFPGPGGKLLVSTGGGIAPRWRRDGKALFFIAPDGKLMAAPIQNAGQTLEVRAPVALFETRIVLGGQDITQQQQYAVAPDGQRFLINIIDEPAAAPITIVTNWMQALMK